MSLKEKLQSNLQELYPGMGRVREATPMAQGSSVTNPSVTKLEKGAGADAATKAGNATTLSPSSGGRDEKPIPQGDSEPNPAKEDLGTDEPGKVAAAKMKKGPVPTNKGAGKGRDTTDVVDPTSVVNQGSSKGNVVKEDTDLEEDDVITEDEFAALTPEEQEEWELVEFEDGLDEDLDDDIDDEVEDIDEAVAYTFDPAVLFEGDETLTEEFKTKAAGIFEAVVTAKVAELREEIENEATRLATEAFAEQLDNLVEAMDAYLSEAVVTWVEENEVAVENGLRTEITENFISGLRNLFAESYIDVPEDRVDVIGEMAEEIEMLRAQLVEQTEITEEVVSELHSVKREDVVREVSEGLALTQADKLRTLVEDVTFEDVDSFKAKLVAIRENFFNSRPEVKPVIIEEKKTDDTVSKLANLLPSPNTFNAFSK